MSDDKDGAVTPGAESGQKQVFISPDKFVYANALRLYGSGPEVFIEFGRSLLPEPGGPPTAKGEIGVVLSLQTAGSLMTQIQQTVAAQVVALQRQNEALQKQIGDAIQARNVDGSSNGG